jgi:hypothetical protein
MLGTDTKCCINSARRAQLSHCDGQSCQAPEPLAVSRKPIANDLGQVYEQFLGKVIRLTAGHQAKVEERSKGILPARAFDRPSAPRKLSAMPGEPRPALTEVELFIMSPELVDTNVWLERILA